MERRVVLYVFFPSYLCPLTGLIVTHWRRRRGKQTSEPGFLGGPGSPAEAPVHSETPVCTEKHHHNKKTN